jgi:tRNA pseudouridine55 synthase
MTSHDVVAAVRRLTGQRRVGHAGTLDPMAEGVLIVGVGQGTRVLGYLMSGAKEYCARLHFGVTTDTDDAEGTVLAVKDVKRFRRHTLEGVMNEFVGRQMQLPPTYSALKQAGQPAYRLARSGAPVERRARPIEIEALRLLSWRRPHAICHVTCSKGTYIRSLARDVGERLGCGAHLCGLVRVRSGAFTIEESVPLPLLEHALAEGYEQELLLPLDVALQDHPAVILNAENTARALQGKDIALETETQETGGEAFDQQPWRAYNVSGEFVAVLVASGRAGFWHADKVFLTPS